MPRRSRPPPPPASSASAPASARPAASACSCRSSLFLLSLDRAEIVFQKLENPVLAGGALQLVVSRRFCVADGKGEHEPPARHLVEGVGEHRRVLRLLGELAG